MGLDEDSVRFRRLLLKAAAANVIRPSWSQLKWDLKYFLGRNDAPGWYSSLFPKETGLLTGEITPAYGLLDDDDVRSIASGNSSLKVIYIIRNPIDRAWSTLSYHFKRGQVDLDSMSEFDMLKYLVNPAIEGRSDYIRVINRWRSYFGYSNFFLAFYDEIRDEPEQLARRIEDFLCIASGSLLLPDKSERINRSSGREIPSRIRTELNNYHGDLLKALARELGSYAEQWLEDSRHDVSKAKSDL